MGLILTSLTAAHEREIISDAPDKDLARDILTEMQPEGQSKMEPKDRETVAGGSPKAPQVTSSNDHVGEGGHETIHLKTSRGGCS